MVNFFPCLSGQFVRFAIVGTFGFAVDASSLYLCLHGLQLGLYEGRIVSYFIAATSTWYLNRRFTFENANRFEPVKQWARFIATNSVGGLVNFSTYSVIVFTWPLQAISPLIGVAFGSLAGLVLNFTVSRLFVFKVAPPCSEQNTEN